MKKLIIAIIATAMTALGLVATTSAPASAACTPTRYVPCVNTVTTVTAPAKVKRKQSVPIKVTVSAPSTVPLRGTVNVVVTRSGKIVYNTTNAYVGGTLTFLTQGFPKKGIYTVVATFSSEEQSTYNGSSASTTFKVKKKRRN